MNEGAHARYGAQAPGVPLDLSALLDSDAREVRADLDKRYGILDDVLAGHRSAVIYPAAGMGRRAAAGLKSIGAHVVAFGDRDAGMQGKSIDGLPVLSPAEIASVHASDAILVASTMFDSEICEDLSVRGCMAVVPVGYLSLRLPEIFRTREYEGSHAAVTDQSNRAAIESAYSLLADDHSRETFTRKLAFYLSLDKGHLSSIRSGATIYFGTSVYDLGADEVVVDGGAYVGDTLESFLHHSSGRFGSYYAFEPDSASYARLSELAATDSARIVTVRAGLGCGKSRARLLRTCGTDSRVLGDDEPGGETIPIVGLDEYFQSRPAPSLIKMDIEGSEADALRGAARILAEARPKLAVSAYHFPTDLWTIPLLINELAPSSRLFLRHYGREIDDTVCYAVP